METKGDKANTKIPERDSSDLLVGERKKEDDDKGGDAKNKEKIGTGHSVRVGVP